MPAIDVVVLQNIGFYCFNMCLDVGKKGKENSKDTMIDKIIIFILV